MMHEARDRQKFFSDVQYLRDMQHKMDFEYQACLRRQENRRDEKKRDQFCGQETGSERSLFSSKASSKQQSSGGEESLTEPRPSSRKSEIKCDSKLPAIDQTPVKQKHKSTMSPRKPEQVGPSKTSPEAPKILSRKGRPYLGRLTVSPEMHSLRAAEDRSRQKWQPPAKAPTRWGPDDPVVHQEDSMWAIKTKLKRTTQEKRNFISSSQLMRTAENPAEGTKQVDQNALSLNEPYSALSQTFQRMRNPQVLSGSLGPPLTSTTMGGPRKTPFRFQDKEFYSMLSLNTEGENNNIGEETYTEEEILLVGMQSPCSPSNYKPSTFLGTSATYAKNKNFEENDEHCRGNSLRSKPNGGSLRISNTMEPVTKQFSVGQRMLQDWPDGQSAEENNRRNSGNEKNTFDSCHTKSNSNPDNDLNDENVSGDCISVHDGPGICDYERDCQDYLSDSRNSPNYLISDRPTAPRSSMNSSYNALGSLMHIALSDHVPTDLSASSTLGHPLDPRFGVCQQLPPIRSRSPSANTENHNYFPGNSAREFGVRRAEGITLPSQPQGAPLYADLLLNPQGSGSPVDSPPSSLPRGNLQGHWHVLGSLRENVPFTFLVISEFPNQNDNTDCTSVSGFTNGKGAPEKKADPEKLKRLQESLLEEDSEEEGDLCRICQIAGGSPTNPLLEPCSCVGSLRFVHQKCLKKWLKVKITSGADLNAVQTCEMCKQVLLVNLDDFNLTDFYQKHQQSRAQSELMNSGLYLMLLLRLYEQRFAELMSLDYRRIVRERLSRNHPQARPEENENSELGDGNESRIYPSRIV
ncbi:probable E3 ubiquitin-protein ligase MARCH10 isoform X1 [Fukomys damarensis]|uniref:probable E3 ubiquitin-protein ligase MARCH10 isoform X1 n=1 Tax=Fukomys damarensis TaxID=885580 RepID=UPI00053FA116|nr:probable E3 ubiquitin-protein ligase MARCH10 isoform X1 [Fukomys damarensis]